MLVLSRRRDERIFIGHGAEIQIQVIEIRGDKVRLGITALAAIPVHRQEVYEKLLDLGEMGEQPA